MACDGIDLEVHEREIVGIAGVDGNGQSELAQVLTGLRPIEAGEIELAGHVLSKDDPWEFITRGVAHVPEDRQKDGLIMEFSLADNLVLQMHRRPPFSRYGFLDNRTIRKHGVELMEHFDVRAPGPLVSAHTLSGGNQQRLVLARELSRKPVLLVASHPTRGLDVGSTEYIQRELLDARQAGSAILLFSQDLDELLALSDRIAVMYRGQVVGILPAHEASVEQIGLMMTGTC
jgi:simple sugar transport system ATP-binding protein